MISALYVDPKGIYPKLGVDCWDAARDANKFAGPGPVVAHPPCAPWSRMRHLSKQQNVKHCAELAVGFVRTYGGVLEHPAHSQLWKAGLCLPRPGELADRWGGFTVEVEQVNWGHPARKRTWLYCVGIPRALVTAGIRRGAEPTHWASGSRGKSSRQGSPVPPGIKVCSAQQRKRTPRAFAEWLIEIASRATPAHAANKSA